MSLIVQKIQLSSNNQKIEYHYTLSDDIKKYFTKKIFFVEYHSDVSKVPYEIQIIPFLVNVMPVAWFANFRVKVEKVDSQFLQALKELKIEFSNHYSLTNPEDCMLDYEDVVFSTNGNPPTKEAMLFSGGVDAYTTYFRHSSTELDLITIQGADINLDDPKQWEDLVHYLENTDVISNNRKHYIKSNLRDFISFEVDKLLPNLGWWGKIQHGMALTGVTAPICYLNNIKTLYIASTRSEKMEFSPWGSMPETDNLVRWDQTYVKHDGYELTRFDKVVSILKNTDSLQIKPPLRVCYNEYKSSLNCNSCEKCLRTIFSILIQGKNPEHYGFVLTDNVYKLIYDKLKNGYSTAGTKMYWEEMVENYSCDNLFIISNKEEEKKDISNLIILINRLKSKHFGNISKYKRFKYQIIKDFPIIFSIYLKIRRKFL